MRQKAHFRGIISHCGKNKIKKKKYNMIQVGWSFSMNNLSVNAVVLINHILFKENSLWVTECFRL